MNLNQRRAGLRLLRGGANRGSKMDVSLQLGWQRAGEVHARCEKRCDRGDADLGLATPEERHDAIRGVGGERVLELRLHLLADSQALQHAIEMHPRRAILRVGDGFRVEQRSWLSRIDQPRVPYAHRRSNASLTP
jgi:hypothetical protein